MLLCSRIYCHPLYSLKTHTVTGHRGLACLQKPTTALPSLSALSFPLSWSPKAVAGCHIMSIWASQTAKRIKSCSFVHVNLHPSSSSFSKDSPGRLLALLSEWRRLSPGSPSPACGLLSRRHSRGRESGRWQEAVSAARIENSYYRFAHQTRAQT